MIDFACKQFSMAEVIKCGLGLSKAEYGILEHLMRKEGKWHTSDALSEQLDLDKSTVQRAMKKLHEKEVVERAQENLDGGGYLYLYRIMSKRHVADTLRSVIRQWVVRVDEELESI